MAQRQPVRRGAVIGRNIRQMHVVAQPALGREQRETKLDTWRRLAQQRLPNVVKSLGLIEKLGNRELYDIRPTDVQKLMAAIRTAVDHCEQALLNGGHAPVDLVFDD